MAEGTMLSMGDVARKLGYPIWKVRRMINCHLPGITKRVGNYQLVLESSLPAVKKVLEEKCFIREK